MNVIFFNTGVSDHNILSSLPRLIGLENFAYLIDDFQILLRDALDIQRDLGAADDRNDKSFIDMPSISPHPQNRNFHEWVLLIELMRNSWLAMRKKNIDYAIHIAKKWFDLPYLTFKRLALCAASQEEKITPKQWVKWLLTDDAFWLWSGNIQRETLRLLVLQGHKLSSSSQKTLEAAILSGPPESIFKTINIETRPDIKDRAIWLRLAKLQSSGLVLGSASAKRLKELSQQYPKWQLASNQKDEFVVWTISSNDPELNDLIESNSIPAPRELETLIQWLDHAPLEKNHFYRDEWRNICQTDSNLCLKALSTLAKQNKWSVLHWEQAFQAWNDKNIVQDLWEDLTSLIQKMPDSILNHLKTGVSCWLMNASDSLSQKEHIILELCERLLKVENTNTEKQYTDSQDCQIEATNHYIGYLTETLLKIWLHRKPNDNDKIPKDIYPLFTILCDNEIDIFRHGILYLCSHLVTFFRVDPKWSKRHLLPMLNWEANQKVAKAAWTGFLFSPLPYSPLLRAFKKDFLDTAKYYNDLGSHAQKFATFLTYSALDTNEGYTTNEFRSAFSALPQQGLENVASALVQAVKGSSEQAETYWKSRVHPFSGKKYGQSL